MEVEWIPPGVAVTSGLGVLVNVGSQLGLDPALLCVVYCRCCQRKFLIDHHDGWGNFAPAIMWC